MNGRASAASRVASPSSTEPTTATSRSPSPVPQAKRHGAGKKAAGQKADPRLASKQYATNVDDQLLTGDVPLDFSQFVGVPLTSAPPNMGRNQVVEPPSQGIDSHREQGWQKVCEFLIKRYKSPRKAFRVLDSNGNGLLSFGEMLEAFDRLKIPWRELSREEDFKVLLKTHPKVVREGVGTEFDMVDFFGEGCDDTDPESDDEADGEHYMLLDMHDKEEVNRFAKWASKEHRWDYFAQMFHEPGTVVGFQARRHVYSDEFSHACKWLKYDGNAAFVFNEIQSQAVTMRERSNRRLHGIGADCISLTQFRQFERKAMLLNSQIHPQVGGSSLSRLTDILMKQRGTLLRGWRMDIDLHGTGKVGHHVFGQACRALGLQGQVQPIWESLRKNRSDPLEFHEIAYSESDNIEHFAELLWGICGCNLSEAWSKLDVNNQNYLTQDEFLEAAKHLGFTGNAKHIFAGLGTPATRRLTKCEFMYLNQVANSIRGRLPRGNALVQELIQWVHCNFGNSSSFISSIGLSGGSQTIGVHELATKITALGFAGNSQAVASRVARLEGGSSVTMNSLSLLLDGKPRTALTSRFSPVVWNASRSSPWSPKSPWNGRIQESPYCGQKITQTPQSERRSPSRGFSPEPFMLGSSGQQSSPGWSGGPLSPRPSSGGGGNVSQRANWRSPSPRRATIHGKRGERYRKSVISKRWAPLTPAENPVANRDDWDLGSCLVSVHNEQLCKGLKACFSKGEDMCPLDRPRHVKNELVKQVEKNKDTVKQRQARRNAQLFRRHMEELGDMFSPGEKVLLCIKAMLDATKRLASQFFYSLDKDGSGELDADEFGASMRDLGFEIDPDDIEALVEFIDKDGSGDVSVKELCSALRETEKKAAKYTQLSYRKGENGARQGTAARQLPFLISVTVPAPGSPVTISHDTEIAAEHMVQCREDLQFLQKMLSAWDDKGLQVALTQCHDYPPDILEACEEFKAKLQQARPIIDSGRLQFNLDTFEMDCSKLRFQTQTPPAPTASFELRSRDLNERIISDIASLLNLFPQKMHVTVTFKPTDRHAQFTKSLAENRAKLIVEKLIAKGVPDGLLEARCSGGQEPGVTLTPGTLAKHGSANDVARGRSPHKKA